VKHHLKGAALNRDSHHSLRSWIYAVALAALIAGPILLYLLLPLVGVPVVLASGVVAVVALKHVGLLAVLVALLYAILRRRSRR
jgi:hypothetical protein